MTRYGRAFGLSVLTVATALSASAVSHAGDTTTRRLMRNWGFEVGGIALTNPKYEGSDQYRFLAFPIVIPHYYGANYDATARPRFTFRGLDDIRYAALRFGNFDFGPLGGYTFGRDQSDAARLNGLGDVDGGLILGAFGTYHFDPFYVDAAIGSQVTGGVGGAFTVTTGIGADFKLTPQLTLSPYLSTTYGSSEYMDNYFTITPAQSSHSSAGLLPFKADAGFKNVSFDLGATYRLTKRWTARGSAGYSRLIGDAADSPVTMSADQFSAMVGLTYTFGRTD